MTTYTTYEIRSGVFAIEEGAVRMYLIVGSREALLLDTGSGALKYEGKTIELTRNEFRILLALMEKRGTVVSREKLMERLWETDSFVDENTLTVNVNRLRKKLDAAGLTGFIATRFGVGYIIE